jgi:4a-hydroxytetrahydrobiopterin dehydratase
VPTTSPDNISAPPERLGATGIRRALAALRTWSRHGREIRRSYRFEDFKAALAFVNRVGVLAEREGHHPDIDIRWNTVLLVLTTHDAGGLTALDFRLAAAFDAVTSGSSSTRSRRRAGRRATVRRRPKDGG